MDGRLSFGGHVKAILRIGIPLIGSHLAQMAIGVTDTLMLGWYDVTTLAASVIGSSLFFVIFIFGAGIGNAVMPMVAQANASGETTQVRRVTRMGMWLAVIFGVLVLPIFVWSAPLLLGMGQEPVVADLAQTYLRIAGPGILPAILVTVLRGFLSGLERTTVLFVATVAAAVLNAIVNYALIFGNWGFPELGIAGAAIASVTTHALTFVVLLVYIRRVLPEHSLFLRLWKPDWEVFFRVQNMAVLIGLTMLAEVGLFAASSVIVGWTGTLNLAAHGIAIQVTSVTFMVHLGLSGVATIRAGSHYGRRDVVALRDGGLAIMVLSLGYSVITAILFVWIPEPMTGLFLSPDDPAREEIIAIASLLLLFGAVFQLADGAQAAAIGLLRGIQDVRVPMVMAALSYWAVGIPVALVLSTWFELGAPGVWMGLIAGLTCAGILLNFRFWRDLSKTVRYRDG
ncbi:MATE family efflux transporter [Amaricoccus tamworthensis]|uniref:MATE family efflux transporter n=1 Tax=Amaricoccus tamworthensis TaxID=57002 RepID=UPI003C7E069B